MFLLHNSHKKADEWRFVSPRNTELHVYDFAASSAWISVYLGNVWLVEEVKGKKVKSV
jgi:hypothetical protein